VSYMPSEKTRIAFSVTEAEKEAIRRTAAKQGDSMAAYVRKQTLDSLPADVVAGTDNPADTPRSLSPLEDFKTSLLEVDPSAPPVAKRTVYDWYLGFCEASHPDHEPESQHKVSREIVAMDGVKASREYLDGETQTRCVKNLKRRDQ